MTEHFLSCDWGTSSFRLKLVRIADLHIVGEVSSNDGIAATFSKYKALVTQCDTVRQSFYLSVIARQLAVLEHRLQKPLDGMPVVLSGMASSTIGMFNMPYGSLPFSLDGAGLATHNIAANETFPHDVLIISGVCSKDDVMRGEETQLIGCLSGEDAVGECLYIFPGTHSKHILVKNNKAVSFTTYMTGEFFALLSTKSILSNAVALNGNSDLGSFRNGVADAAGSNLLHTAFLTRTNDLFGKLTKEENYNYLSGVLIGTELKALKGVSASITLCSSGNLLNYYCAALDVLLPGKKVKVFPAEQVDNGVIRGQLKIFLSNTDKHHGKSI